MLFSRYSWVVTLRTVLTNASWTITDLCSFVAIFAFILSFDYRQYRHTFNAILKYFFLTVKFPKNNICCLLHFCSFMSQQNENFHIPYMSKHIKHEKNFLLIGYISRFFTWLFLHHKEGTESFPARHFLWQFSHNMKSVMLNFTKLKYANLVEWNSILTLSCHETRSWSLCLYFFKCCFVPENTWNSQSVAS